MLRLNQKLLSNDIASEADNPPNKWLFAGVLFTGLIVVLHIVLLEIWLKKEAMNEITVKETSQPSRALLERRATDFQKLNAYDVVDEQKGLYQIPIEKAVDALIANPSYIDPAGKK